MKRSEAYKLFYELACSAEEDGWLDNPMCVAENFLAKAEEIMLPPTIVNPVLKGMSIYEHAYEMSLDELYNRKHRITEDYYINEWEAEDDIK